MQHLKTFKSLSILILLFTFIFATAADCFAQQEWINTDRPDQTDGTYTVPAKKFQIEDGVMFVKETVLNNFMLRYGVGKSTELRLALDAGKAFEQSGLQPVTLSLKQRFLEQRGALPAIAFIGNVSFGKLASKSFQVDEIPFELKLAFDNDLSEKFSIGYNLGTSNQFMQFDFTFEVGYSFSEPLSVFLEYFSSFYKGDSEHNLDAGILYAVTRTFQLDFAAGIALNNTATPNFGTIGFSYLLD